jgi:dipeptidyl aminopeptidase/acylaminoacyl peptidase
MREGVGIRKTLLIVFAALLLQAVAFQAQDLKAFTVRDSIELVRFDAQDAEQDEQVQFAPDERSFTVVTKRGILASNAIESTVWLFDTQEVRRFVNSSSDVSPPRPRVVARVSSSSSGSPITHLRWSSDGHTVAFIGSNGNRVPGLFVVEVNSHRLRELSPEDQAVSAFDQVDGTYVFTAGPDVRDVDLYQSAGPQLSDIQVGTGKSLLTLLFPRFEATVFGLAEEHLWKFQKSLSRIDDSRTLLPINLVRGSYLHLLALSPTGRYVVAVNNLKQVPSEWESYEPAASYAKFEASDGNATPTLSDLSPAQYVMIDLQHRQMWPLVNAPLGVSAAYYQDVVRAQWSKDEKRIAISNTFVPPSATAAGRVPRRPCVAVVDVVTHVTECVSETPAFVNGKPEKTISDIEWRNSDQDILVRYHGHDGHTESEFFHRENGVWKGAADCSKGTGPNMRLAVAVQESVNAPPALVARDVETRKSKRLWDPNPQLASINVGKAEVYRWRDKNGHDWIGGLVLPPKYTSGRRYPLVIQTHGFDPDKFLSDGFYSTANAARALAARGIAVLQVAEPRWALFSPQDPELDGTLGYESAIAHLSSDGVIDPGRVGIIGFSHTGIYVLDSLIHLPDSFAAATLAECSTDSLWEYLINADYRGPQTIKVATDLIGSTPFGDGVGLWLSRSPGFNTDKIRAPILFEENSPPTLVYSWDLYAALRLQAKPVELLYMRSGKHVLEQPAHLYASQEMNADWYDFWLNGHEDPNPTKAPQYVRWHQLRVLQGNRSTHAQ